MDDLAPRHALLLTRIVAGSGCLHCCLLFGSINRSQVKYVRDMQVKDTHIMRGKIPWRANGLKWLRWKVSGRIEALSCTRFTSSYS